MVGVSRGLPERRDPLLEAVLQRKVGLQLEHQVIITAHCVGGESVKVTRVCGDPLPRNVNVMEPTRWSNGR